MGFAEFLLLHKDEFTRLAGDRDFCMEHASVIEGMLFRAVMINDKPPRINDLCMMGFFIGWILRGEKELNDKVRPLIESLEEESCDE